MNIGIINPLNQNRIKKLFPFRQDCNLQPLINAWNLSSSDSQTLINYALKYLPSQVSTRMCGSLVTPPTPNVNNIQNSISKLLFLNLKFNHGFNSTFYSKKDSGLPIGALYSQQALNQLNSNDKLSILATLGSSSSNTIDKNTAHTLGKSLPPNTNFTQCLSVASTVPINVLTNAKPQDIINNINKMDVGNMDSARIGYLASKISANASDSQMNTLLSSNQASIIQA